METYELKAIARVHSDFKTKFGIPRQSGLVEQLKATVVFEPEFRNADAFRGIEQYSHLWLIWQFSEAIRENWSPTVRPPRLGGNTRVGVFATRSPYRPNAIGLSSVRLDRIEYTAQGPVLHISGGDLLDGTPVFDIKPYLSFTDSHPDAECGFAEQKASYSLKVEFDPMLLERLPNDKREAAVGILSGDPRPSYQNDTDRVYGIEFAGFDIRFKVSDQILTVTDVIEH